MDKLTPERRSWNMSRITGRNTVPERKVRSLLHRLGFRFSLRSQKLPGRPDIVLKSRNTAIFVHGCFWHRHPGCRFATTPATRAEFWAEKFRRNRERDAANEARLRQAGWEVLTVWECETKSGVYLEPLLDKLRARRPAS